MNSAPADAPVPDFQWRHVLNAPVIVAALGYLVDIYDLLLFSIVRVKSLKDIGVADAALLTQGTFLLNAQMTGMLLGGVLWGILGDRRGRLTVLFGSITLYSLANIGNGFVQSVPAYAVLRLLAGIGLAGELGAGVTLVAEALPRHARGYGTAVVATVGVSGALLAVVTAKSFAWRTTYFIGGGLGLLLLLLRVGVVESGMFRQVERLTVARGRFFALFHRARLGRFLRCILIGIPIWYVVGVLVTFSPELAGALGVRGKVTALDAVFWSYVGLVGGDLASGVLSQWLHSRRRVVGAFIGGTAVLVGAYFSARGVSTTTFYVLCLLLGISIGYWAVLVTIAAEQFGTNLRATVATSVPNFVRGATVPITFAFAALKGPLGIAGAGALVGAICLGLAAYALWGLDETFGKDLDFVEDI